ncbi:hypothetical protein GJV26_00010 [Massilia dura]|uniref:Uncharacterized protein n=1 Tax=Pseudoduganella dura TaxID=321982 RepID=A0A6I3X8D9_9BURK|nr:hypothetical protein [Pseudoduganella dura]MUI10880.1 hypothetical protein [Pseudoduganella dura]GGY12745.1 hypothetical protein GCM10007386_48810 [Pseudoduganella dura]
MTVTSCIACKNFTVTPRSDRKDLDASYRARGMGRCKIDSLSARWIRAEAPRECGSLVPIDTQQIEARRRHLATHQA